jgi:hypothetical protein
MYIVIANDWKFNNVCPHPEFYLCADAKLGKWVLEYFNWNAIPEGVRLTSGLKHFDQGFTPDSVSTWKAALLVGSFSHPCRLCYRTNFGTVYYPHFRPNCQDLEFWIEDLDSEAVINSLESTNKQ